MEVKTESNTTPATQDSSKSISSVKQKELEKTPLNAKLEENKNQTLQEPITENGKNGKDSKTPKKYSLTINGEVKELDEKTVLMLAQKAMGADEKFAKAYKIKKQAEDLITYAKSNLPEFLRNLNIDPHEWAENIIMDRIKIEKMTPEQRELMEVKKKLNEMEEEKRRIEQEKKEIMIKETVEKIQNDLTEKIIEQLEKSKLPKTPRTVARIAHYMLEGLKNGVRFSPADVIDVVWEDYVREHQEMYGELPSDKLLNLFNESIRKKIREIELEQIKGMTDKMKQVQQSLPPISDKTNEENKRKKYLTLDEFREYNKKLLEEE